MRASRQMGSTPYPDPLAALLTATTSLRDGSSGSARAGRPLSASFLRSGTLPPLCAN